MDTSSPQWRPDLQRLWADLEPKPTPAKKRELCTLHQGLKDQRDAGQIPSLSAALWAEAPSCVGANLWFLCVANQRREPAAAQLPPLDMVPDDVFPIIARFAAAAKQTRDAPDGLLPLFLSHRRGRDLVDWQAVLHDLGAGDLWRPRWGESRDAETDDESSDESDVKESYVKAHSRHVLMHTYFRLRRARILWQGERPMALECLCAGGIAGVRLTEGLRRVEPPIDCHAAETRFYLFLDPPSEGFLKAEASRRRRPCTDGCNFFFWARCSKPVRGWRFGPAGTLPRWIRPWMLKQRLSCGTRPQRTMCWASTGARRDWVTVPLGMLEMNDGGGGKRTDATTRARRR